MAVRTHRDAVTLLDRVGAVLRADEAAAIMPLGLLAALAAHPDAFGGGRYWEIGDADGPRAAALQTPGHNIVIGGHPAPSDVDELVGVVLAAVPDLPGVMAAPSVADRFVEAWTAATAQTARVQLRQGVYELTELVPPAPTAGAGRPARLTDRDRLVAWLLAFHDEAGVPGAEHAAASVDFRLDGGDDRGWWMWEAGGQPVAMAGFSGPTGTGIRIGPVYTPPSRRGAGFGTSLTAALSENLLARGFERCFLFTDLANPTSNAIYRRVGYRRVGDSIEYGFDR